RLERECARKRRDRGHRTRSSHADEEEIESRAAFGRQDQASEAEGDEKGQVRTCGFDRLVSGDQKSGGAEASSGDLARYRPVLEEEGAHLIAPDREISREARDFLPG